MEVDPLGPSITVNYSPVVESIDNNSLENERKSDNKPQELQEFICLVCNNEFDDMAKLHVHMSMKHKGIKV